MFLLPSPQFFLEFQICHYQKRLKEETKPFGKNWLQKELSNLTKNDKP